MVLHAADPLACDMHTLKKQQLGSTLPLAGCTADDPCHIVLGAIMNYDPSEWSQQSLNAM